MSTESKRLILTAGEVTDIGTEIQRHYSRCISSLSSYSEGYIRKLQRNSGWLDIWAIAALRVRTHGLRVVIHPEDERRDALLELIKMVSKIKNQIFADSLCLTKDPMAASILVISRSHMVNTELDGTACFVLLVEEKPLNPALLDSPTMFWVKESECPQAIAPIFCRLLSMR